MLSDRLLTVDEVAEWLQVAVRTIYAWRVRGVGPPAIRVGGQLRFRRSDIERWLEEHCNHPK